jgi:hypothetical protein
MAEMTADAASKTPSVKLQLVSPSAGINQRLMFSDLPPSTTLKQLRERVRNVVPSQPADDHQRLIHRGRLLTREDDTLQDVLGSAAVSSAVSHLDFRCAWALPCINICLHRSNLESFKRSILCSKIPILRPPQPRPRGCLPAVPRLHHCNRHMTILRLKKEVFRTIITTTNTIMRRLYTGTTLNIFWFQRSTRLTCSPW